ncbi:hypothetical protein RhiTH_011406 [Rhizoctonia solani]
MLRTATTVWVTTSQGIEITFEFNSPPQSSIPPRQSYEFLIATDSQVLSNSSDYYKSLRGALSQAKARTGEDLTKYRDLAAEFEKHKIVEVKTSSDDEDEDTEE